MDWELHLNIFQVFLGHTSLPPVLVPLPGVCPFPPTVLSVWRKTQLEHRFS